MYFSFSMYLDSLCQCFVLHFCSCSHGSGCSIISISHNFFPHKSCAILMSINPLFSTGRTTENIGLIFFTKDFVEFTGEAIWARSFLC